MTMHTTRRMQQGESFARRFAQVVMKTVETSCLVEPEKETA
jgi:hypothetical protein